MKADRSCVLAYSGGLDTSAIVPWLRERGYEVHALVVDVGQGEDFTRVCERALTLGARSATVRDVRAEMADAVLPFVIGLGAMYEGQYRLGTAIARPFIAKAHVERARELGATKLVHGATGKGNDQIRFEFAYRSLAPECSVLAPWKVWSFRGRQDLVRYLESIDCPLEFEANKVLSLDENLWHLSVEGGPLENPASTLSIDEVLGAVRDRFAGGAEGGGAGAGDPKAIEVTFTEGRPTALDGRPMSMLEIVGRLNRGFRHAPWAWDLVTENRCTGVKSRGLYVNPAAVLLQTAADGLARTVFHKAAFDAWMELGRDYGGILYRGEYFSHQRTMIEAAARALITRMTGIVRLEASIRPCATRIESPCAIFRPELSTFEASNFDHADAKGFIQLSWLSAIGCAATEESRNESALETGSSARSVVSPDPSLSH